MESDGLARLGECVLEIGDSALNSGHRDLQMGLADGFLGDIQPAVEVAAGIVA